MYCMYVRCNRNRERKRLNKSSAEQVVNYRLHKSSGVILCIIICAQIVRAKAERLEPYYAGPRSKSLWMALARKGLPGLTIS